MNRRMVVALVWVWIALAAAAQQRPEGTLRMVERLEAIARAGDPKEHPFLNAQRAMLFSNEWVRLQQAPAGSASPQQILETWIRFADELMKSGATREAIAQFDQIVQRGVPGMTLRSRDRNELLALQALAYLRLGEQENCVALHTSDSCLVPIRDQGVHRLQAGSRGAIGLLTNLLSSYRSDLRSRWLLNLACMTVGEYPEKVGASWLIPPRSFGFEYDIKRFRDVAAATGLDVNSLAGGVVMEDLDRDGFLDLLVSAWGARDPLRYFRNLGDGRFEERSTAAGLEGLVGGLNLLHADYDNDGWTDVLVLRGAWFAKQGHHPNSLLRNRGDGTFEDVTEAAGMLSYHPKQAAAWFDFNRDGWLDLYVGNETTADDVNPCELYRNNRNGTFTECAAPMGVAQQGYVKAVVAGDYDNDGWPDLYLSQRGQPNVLFRNEGPQGADRGPDGPWKFRDMARAAGVTEPLVSFATFFFDYNNDGWLDLFVSGFDIRNVGDVAADYLGLPHKAETVRLYRNRGDASFEDVTKAAGLWHVMQAMSCNFGDLDNDGFLDFYLGTGDPDLSVLIPNLMFRNAEGRVFQNVSGSGSFGHVQKGHGIAFGDLDNDGDQDVYAVMGGAYEGDAYRNSLFENPGHSNHWIVLELEGVRANRSAIGARLQVMVETAQGTRSIYKWVNTGGSFGSAPLRQHMGLGSATRLLGVKIRWPAAVDEQTVAGLELDRYYRIREGAANAVQVSYKAFQLPSAGAHGPAHVHPEPVKPRASPR